MLIVRHMPHAQEASRYGFSLVMDLCESHFLVDLCGLDCLQTFLANQARADDGE